MPKDTQAKTRLLHDCIACGYVYDPEKGDPYSEIPPGTSFEDLPEDWVCPECGVDKDFFESFEAPIEE